MTWNESGASTVRTILMGVEYPLVALAISLSLVRHLGPRIEDTGWKPSSKSAKYRQPRLLFFLELDKNSYFIRILPGFEFCQ